jgi:hypothetical protein
MNNDEINAELALEALAQPPPPHTPMEFKCDVIVATEDGTGHNACGKAFQSANALRMHKARVHGNMQGQPRTLVERRARELERKRAYNRQLRAKRYAQGLDARGVPRPPGYEPRKMPPWTPERKAKFQATMRRLRVGKKQPKKQIRYVYPEPEQAEQQPITQMTNIRKMNHCPYCGEHILHHITSGGWQ